VATHNSRAERQIEGETTLEHLIADPRNARRHPDRNIAMIQTALEEVGAARSLVIDEQNVILAGNGVHQAAERAGLTKVRIVETDGDTIVAVRRSGLTDQQKQRLALFDNRAAELAQWDVDALLELRAAGLALEPLWTADELCELLGDEQTAVPGLTDPEAIPKPRSTSIVMGDLFELGAHRLLCGDTTDPDAVRRVLDGRICTMHHVDPPYGMGKEADGIANDNIYGAELDAFQMRWWRAWLPGLTPNGSAYVWGNAPDLWRLWWTGGLAAQKDLLVRNEIVWDKGSACGMASDLAHCYAPATERCLFLMRGPQFLGNQNKDDYWEGYEPLRTWLVAERDRAGWTIADIHRITGTQMAGHWFGQSQFQPISRHHYHLLAAAAAGSAFAEPYDDLFDRMFGGVRDGGNAHRRQLAERVREARSFFDNTHDVMTDVWQFPRVVGEERFGHATPKPVAMVARALKSSSRIGDVIGVPFAGTGPEIIAAEQFGRACCAIEIEPAYCQIVIDRWEAFTGQHARKLA
jgi:DNA modification methylase